MSAEPGSSQYKALAERINLYASLGVEGCDRWRADLRTVVTMLKEMADEKPALWMQSNHVSWAGKQPFMARCAPTQLQPDFVPLHLHPAPQPQLSYEDIAGAIARAWCHQKNEHKEMDADLALAAANEVMEVLLHGAPQPQPILSGYGDYGAAIPGIERPCTCHPDDNPPVPCAQKYALNECRAAPLPQSTVSFDDASVQRVYGILCSEDVPPDDEHWEGFTARRIVDALSEPTDAQIEAWAHEIWAAAQTAPCEGIENAVDRIVGALRAALAAKE